MTLEDLGYEPTTEKYRQENNLEAFDVGRVIAEHRERYVVRTAEKEYDAEIIGNLRYSANSRADFPAVGDWVAISGYGDDSVLIHAVFPRRNMLERQAVGKYGEKQIIAANIDRAFIIQAVDRDLNVNRLERYLTICHSSKVDPVILLTKTDLVDEQQLSLLLNSIKHRLEDIPVIAISNESRQGYETLGAFIEKGKTCCMLGSSGVGKSTLMNNLTGRDVMKTGAISSSTNKGRHVTSHRELVVLEGGGILIDNPGMREVGITDTSDGLETTFDKITVIARNCKYVDCTHTGETGCAVLEAVESGEIDKRSHENFLKMERDRARFESSAAEKRKRDKTFGKLMKNYKKDMGRNGY